MGQTPLSFNLPPIYPITDKLLAGETSHLGILKELVRGGASLVQIRDKQTPIKELLADLLGCAEFCSKHGILLIINDRCDLALSAGAAGVHLGQEDLPPESARKLLGPESIIGYSTHSLAQIHAASALPIQYVGFGPVYSTTTKQQASPVVGIPGLRRACSKSRLPVVAIGGIGHQQITDVLNAGAASAAVISALMRPGKIAATMERMLNAARAIG
jgi:thiamine-phosphate pyrophosphorylase